MHAQRCPIVLVRLDAKRKTLLCAKCAFGTFKSAIHALGSLVPQLRLIHRWSWARRYFGQIATAQWAV